MEHIKSAFRRVVVRIPLLWLIRDHLAFFQVDASTAIEDVKRVLAGIDENDVLDTAAKRCLEDDHGGAATKGCDELKTCLEDDQ
jgi:hypothetical protein